MKNNLLAVYKKAILPSLVVLVFNASGQQIISVTPDNSERGKTLDVTITGTNTHFGQGTSSLSNSVWFTESGNSYSILTPASVNATTMTSMTVNLVIPANQNTGYYDVYHMNSSDGLLKKDMGFLIDFGTGITESEKTYGLDVYPVPTRDKLSVNLNLKERTSIQISIVDIQGKLIYTGTKSIQPAGKFSQTFSVAELNMQKGSYVLRILAGYDTMSRVINIE